MSIILSQIRITGIGKSKTYSPPSRHVLSHNTAFSLYLVQTFLHGSARANLSVEQNGLYEQATCAS